MNEEDIEMIIYQKLCKYCPNQKLCHDECETCVEYDETYWSATGENNDYKKTN